MTALPVVATFPVATLELVTGASQDNFTVAEETGKTNKVFLVEASPSENTEETLLPEISATFPSATDPSDGTLGTVIIRASDRDWTGKPADMARPNIHFIGRMAAINFNRSLPLLTDSASRIALATAQIGLANNDGYFDDYIVTDQLSIDNRDIDVYLLPARSSDFTEGSLIFNGLGVSWVANQHELTLNVAGQNYGLSVPMLDLYGGTGSGDGDSNLAGLPIIQVYGQCLNVSPQIENSAQLIYQIHNRQIQSIDGVYVRGAPITAGTSRANYAALVAGTPSAGFYDWTITATGTYIKLGSSPDGPVTMDVKGDAAGSYVSTTADIVNRLLLMRLDSTIINTDSFTDFNNSVSGVVGIAYAQQVAFDDAISQLVGSIGGYWGDVGDGLISIGRIGDPTASHSGYAYDKTNVYDEVAVSIPPDSINPSVYRQIVGYANNFTPMSANDIIPAGTITEARRTQLQQPYNTVQFLDANRLNSNPLAKSPEVLPSAFRDSADAQTLADNLGTLYSSGRMLYTFTTGYSGYSLRLNGAILLTWPRYGLDGGKKLRIVDLSYKGRFVTVTGFG